MSDCIYSCAPKRRIGAAIAVCAFFFCGAMAFSAVGLNNQLRKVFNLTALLMLVICFLVMKRFLATSYTYAVYSGEMDELVIYEHTLADKDPAVVGRIALSDIAEVRVVRAKKGRKKEKTSKREKTRFYNYAVSVFEREYIAVTYADGDETVEMRLTFCEGLAEALE